MCIYIDTIYESMYILYHPWLVSFLNINETKIVPNSEQNKSHIFKYECQIHVFPISRVVSSYGWTAFLQKSRIISNHQPVSVQPQPVAHFLITIHTSHQKNMRFVSLRVPPPQGRHRSRCKDHQVAGLGMAGMGRKINRQPGRTVGRYTYSIHIQYIQVNYNIWPTWTNLTQENFLTKLPCGNGYRPEIKVSEGFDDLSESGRTVGR